MNVYKLLKYDISGIMNLKYTDLFTYENAQNIERIIF